MENQEAKNEARIGGSGLNAGLGVTEVIMARTLEMFEKPRKQREWLMHVCDAASEGEGEQLVQYRCYRCGHESEWETAASVTAAKRGIPCPKCNMTPNVI